MASVEIVVERGILNVVFVAQMWKLEQWKPVSKVAVVESRWRHSQSSDCDIG